MQMTFDQVPQGHKPHVGWTGPETSEQPKKLKKGDIAELRRYGQTVLVRVTSAHGNQGKGMIMSWEDSEKIDNQLVDFSIAENVFGWTTA
jgi:hypothetical protein